MTRRFFCFIHGWWCVQRLIGFITEHWIVTISWHFWQIHIGHLDFYWQLILTTMGSWWIWVNHSLKVVGLSTNKAWKFVIDFPGFQFRCVFFNKSAPCSACTSGSKLFIQLVFIKCLLSPERLLPTLGRSGWSYRNKPFQLNSSQRHMYVCNTDTFSQFLVNLKSSNHCLNFTCDIPLYELHTYK